jgi:formylglycine-generating enzyme required for sulfatase activity/uncharacterized caspase-like protein
MSKNWAICIGINRYYNLQPLQYAVKDAASVRDFFLNEIKFEQVYYFADDSPPIVTPRGEMRSLPTYANLKRFFREWFQSVPLSVGDNFWFFFAGHGELHEDHDYLLPIDVDPGDIPGTALRVSDIADSLRNCGADNTVLLVDACRDRGKRKGQGFGVEAQKGTITIYSCSPNRSSYEIEALQHGAFTYALLEGLRLQGANNCATVERLDQYLCAQVPALNERYGKPSQTPRTSVEPISKNYLILIPQQATRLQDVMALKSEAREAELEGNFDFAGHLWVRVLAASPADSAAVKAIGRIAIKQAQITNPASPPATAGSRRIESSVTTAEPEPQAPTFSFEVITVDDRGEVIKRELRSAEYRTEDLRDGVSLELVSIPSGEFVMGSPADKENRDWTYEDLNEVSEPFYNVEGPQQRVSLQSFWMGKYPVTQSQWRAVAALPSVKIELNVDPSYFKGDRLPVEQVSWHDAVEFCQRLSKHTNREYRFPSEAEWEYACRAGTTTAFHFGETLTSDLANYNATETYGDGPTGQYREQTTEVGSFPANAFGLYDMHGNVWERCQDHWHENYIGAPTNGSAWLSTEEDADRLLRGGSWRGSPDLCCSARRSYFAAAVVVGFRVVCASLWTLK